METIANKITMKKPFQALNHIVELEREYNEIWSQITKLMEREQQILKELEPFSMLVKDTLVKKQLTYRG